MKTKQITKTLIISATLSLAAAVSWAQDRHVAAPEGNGEPPAFSQSGPDQGRGEGPRRGPKDLDGDGLISLEEFTAPAEARFKARDLDGDGVLSLQETLVEVNEHFVQADGNGDGYLSSEEMPRRRAPREASQPRNTPAE